MDISEDAFMDEYVPVEAGAEGDFMFDTLDSALNKAEALTDQLAGQDAISHVWTIMEADEGEALYAAAGNHVVNALGFIVTEKAWETGLEQAIWAEDEPETALSMSPG